MTTPEILLSSVYDEKIIMAQVGELLDRHLPRPPHSGQRVLIKPNLLLSAPPERGILTHPFVVKAAVKWVLDHGGKAIVADSPAMGTVQRIWKAGGFADVMEDMDLSVSEFCSEKKVAVGAPFGTIALAKEALETDLIINLPKFKTHAMMALTLGVKNLFGCVVGFEKPKWHARAGIERNHFARLLVRIAEAVSPSVTLVDGITGLQGQGPGKSGEPVHLGCLVAGSNVHEVDALCAAMTPLLPSELPTLTAAHAMGVLPYIPSPPVGIPHFPHFKLPTQSPVTFGPLPLKNLIRRHMVQRPVVDPAKCRQCSHCLEYCPANAISKTSDAIAFDLKECIRCYCCVEVCPHAALEAADPPLGRLVQRTKNLIDRIS